MQHHEPTESRMGQPITELPIIPGHDDSEIDRKAEFDEDPYAALCGMAYANAAVKNPDLLTEDNKQAFSVALKREMESLFGDLINESWDATEKGSFFVVHMNALREMYAGVE